MAKGSRPLGVTRRTVLRSAIAALLLPNIARAREGERLVAACDSRDGRHFLGWVEEGTVRTLELPYRAHDMVAKPGSPGQVLALPRRPGTLVCEVDLHRKRIVTGFTANDGRRFHGHGRVSSDERYLYTTENDYVRGRGVIGIRDGRDYHHLAELDSHGIGPHDLALTPDGTALVVANGGILTHPERGRRKLNLDTMQPNLTYLDVESGTLLRRYTLAERHDGIRHLAVAEDGAVAIAMQFERAASGHTRLVPLVAVQRGDAEPQLLDQPAEGIASLADYCGSVAVDSRRRTVAVTSPRGHSACFWHLDTGDLKARVAMPRVCGVALTTDGEHFVLSNDLGALRYVRAEHIIEDAGLTVSAAPWMWDNHLIALSL